DADARLKCASVRTLELLDSADDGLRGANRMFRRILVGLRIAEVGKHTVAHELGDESIESSDRAGTCILEAMDERAHVLRIEQIGEFGRADQVAEHDRDLTPFRV